jgi:hypothetical protein
MGDTYLTKDGLVKLRAEHKALLAQKRELTEEVSKAAAMGDLRASGSSMSRCASPSSTGSSRTCASSTTLR